MNKKTDLFILIAIFIVTIVAIVFAHFKSTDFDVEKFRLSDNSVGVLDKAPNTKEIKSLKKILKDANSEILNPKGKLNEIGIIETKTKQTRDLYSDSDKVYNKEGKDPLHYFYKEITKKNDKGEEVKIAWVMYYPNQPKDKQWKTGVFPMSITTTVVESENTDGTFNRYAEVRLKDKNKLDIPAEVESIKWAKKPVSEKSFRFWNPRLGLSVSYDEEILPGLNLSLMSYGRTDVDMDLRFLTSSIKMNADNFIAGFEPFSYNVGNILPVVENMFVGPEVSYNFTDQEMKYGVQISIPF